MAESIDILVEVPKLEEELKAGIANVNPMIEELKNLLAEIHDDKGCIVKAKWSRMQILHAKISTAIIEQEDISLEIVRLKTLANNMARRAYLNSGNFDVPFNAPYPELRE